MSSVPDARPERRGPDDPDLPTGIETTERYETDEGVVFFDATNPLAWLQTEHTLDLDEQA